MTSSCFTQCDIFTHSYLQLLTVTYCYLPVSYFPVLDPPETDAATKEREELLKVLAELAGRLEHELKEVNSYTVIYLPVFLI